MEMKKSTFTFVRTYAPCGWAGRCSKKVCKRRRCGMQYATVRPPVSLAGETTEDGDDASASKEVEASLRALFEIGADENCVQCIGKGEIECPLCMGKGFTSMRMMDVVSSSTCRLCHGRCIAPCPTCREEVYRSVLWWDRIPTDDVEERWREGPDGPRIEWGGNPTEGG